MRVFLTPLSAAYTNASGPGDHVRNMDRIVLSGPRNGHWYTRHQKRILKSQQRHNSYRHCGLELECSSMLVNVERRFIEECGDLSVSRNTEAGLFVAARCREGHIHG